MKKIFLISAILTLSLSSCLKDKFNGNPTSPEKDWSGFSYTTETETSVNVSYRNMGGITAPVYFEIYDTKPVEENADGSCYIKIDGLEPLFAATTGEDGNYSATVKLPAYLGKVYVYTPAFYARTLIEAQVTNGSLTATDAFEPIAEAPATSGTRAKNYESEAVSKDGWKKHLGNYDTTYGRIEYPYSGPLKYKNFSQLYTAHSEVINTKRSCPEEYRSSRDLFISETAEIVVTFLGSNTCWNCSMGYYFYRDGQKPASLSEANVIMLFPNTQDGQWGNNISLSQKYIGTKRGTAVQLKYYPDINDKKSGTTVFPAGVRVGFVLACNAWTNRLSGFNTSKGYRSATSVGLSVNDNGTPFATPRTAVYRYINDSKGINAVMFSFEDYTSDENFSDVVFTLVSNPVEAVTDLPSVEGGPNEQQSVKTLLGVYAFEDLWPSRGDGDLNDVMLKANYERQYDKNGTHEESFLFKSYNNIAGMENGFAVTLTGAAASASLKYSIKLPDVAGQPAAEFSDAQFTRDGNVILITDNVKESIGATYKITATYNKPVTQSSTAVPFIYSTTRSNLTPGLRWEVHLPQEAPSPRVDPKFFGTDDDCSNPAKGIYYVRQQKYPFAFFLAGATDTDLSPMLDFKNEKTPIDLLYPDYIKWLESQGKTHTDWYKK